MTNVSKHTQIVSATMLTVAIMIAFWAPSGFSQSDPRPVAAYRADRSKDESQGKVVRQQLFRPLDFLELKDYVEREFEGRFNPSSLESRINADGYSEVEFTRFEDGMLSEITIVDRGYFLELKSVTVPAFDPVLTESKEDKDLEDSREDKGPIALAESKPLASAMAVTKTCGTLSSTGNPYGCCGTAPNDGNCTFAAWELSKRSWGFALPAWGDAGTWYDRARSAGIPTSPTVALFSIAVSKTLSSGGHVGQVTAVNGPPNNRFVTLSEEQCILSGKSLPLGSRSFSIGNFVGFILNPAVTSQSITVYSRSPLYLYASTSDQQVLFSASNIQGNLKAIVTFPSGYVATLEPSAQIWIYGYQTIGTRMRLSERGTYSIQFFNPNGSFSKLFYFPVL